MREGGVSMLQTWEKQPLLSKTGVIRFLVLMGKLRQTAKGWGCVVPMTPPTIQGSSRN